MQQGFESGPAALPVEIAISEPPIAPVVLSFDSSPETEPPAAPGPRPRCPSRARLLAAWGIDLALLSALFLANLVAASRLGGRPEDLAGVLGAAPTLWVSLAALLAVAWSWIFVALCGRTPGMAVAGQRLQLDGGGRPTPARALVRAVLALAFALPGMFGFVLALFDARGQTLHDKACRCISVVD